MRQRMPELTQVFLDPSEVTSVDLDRTQQSPVCRSRLHPQAGAFIKLRSQ
jgi:hypothetical protein